MLEDIVSDTATAIFNATTALSLLVFQMSNLWSGCRDVPHVFNLDWIPYCEQLAGAESEVR